MNIIFTTRLILGSCTDGRKDVLEQTGGADQHNITEAAPNELKLGEDGYSDESWLSARRWRPGVFIRRRLRSQHRRFGAY